MTILLASLIVAAAPASAAVRMVEPPATAAASKTNCPKAAQYQAWKEKGKLAPMKLGDLPAANAFKAVLRTVDGCNVPVIVKYGIGGR